ncbi:hypothetical protein Tco_0567401 [Tanacetum coccineum]
MDDPNITMEEYIRLEEEKAQKRGKVFSYTETDVAEAKVSFLCFIQIRKIGLQERIWRIRTMPQRLGRLKEEVQALRQDVRTLRGLVERSVNVSGQRELITLDDVHVCTYLMTATRGSIPGLSMEDLSEGVNL